MSRRLCFCSCAEATMETSMQCRCGEELNDFEWAFEEPSDEVPVQLTSNRREVKFHPTLSSGTAALRGDKPLTPGRHYLWEIKMTNKVYGTDIMIGIGTSKVDLNGHSREFISLLGETEESWGFSYKGKIYHKGKWTRYGSKFGKGSIIGVHLDLWNGIIEFYVNRKYMGVAFHVKPQVVYPMVSSTASNSALRLLSCSSWESSLQLECLRCVSSEPSLAEHMHYVPGIRSSWGDSLMWLFFKGRTAKEEEENLEGTCGGIGARGKIKIVIVSSDDEYGDKRCSVRVNRNLRPRRKYLRRE